jgi:ABC-type uncharacterized transport system ATPase component
MNKYFKEVVTLKSLEFKLSSQIEGRTTDLLLDSEPSLAAQFKNVCAPIPLALNDELENMLGLLSMSKRQFMTLAIASAIDESRALMDEIDVIEYHKEFDDLQQAKEAVQ